MNPIKSRPLVAYFLFAAVLHFTSLHIVTLAQARSLTTLGGSSLFDYQSDAPRSTVRQSQMAAAGHLVATVPTTSMPMSTETLKPSKSAMRSFTAKHPALGSVKPNTAVTNITTSTRKHWQQDNTDMGMNMHTTDTITDIRTTTTETDTDVDACTRAFEPFDIGERDTVPTSCFSLDPISLPDDPDSWSSVPDTSSQDLSLTQWTTFDTPIPASDLSQPMITTESDSRSNNTSTTIGSPGANSTDAMNATMMPGLLPTVTFTTTICLW